MYYDVNIWNDKDLELTYKTMKFFKEQQKEYPQIEDMVIAYKRAIRKYNHNKQDYYDMDRRIINNKNWDSVDVLTKLPKHIDSMEKADEYFREYHYREVERTEYDCTGQIFTAYYNIYKRNDAYIVYSHECMDC